MKVQARAEVNDHVFDEYDHSGLTPGRVYPVIGIEADHYRLLDDCEGAYLYPKYLFVVIDSSIPDSWVRTDYDSEQYSIDPPELSEQFFWEEFHDKNSAAIAKFRQYRDRVNELGE